MVNSGDAVTVTVRDNGPGVPSGSAEDIFRQGFSTKEPGPGDARGGFGLALSRVICRRSGGDLTVSNDDGAVFTARFNKNTSISDKPDSDSNKLDSTKGTMQP